MKVTLTTLSVLALAVCHVAAFPRIFNTNDVHAVTTHTVSEADCPHLAAQKSESKQKRAATFDPEAQHVSTIGQHAFVAPNLDAGDQRGPCPGLNALANHG